MSEFIGRSKKKRYNVKGIWKAQNRPTKYTKDWWEKAKQFQIDFISESDLDLFLSKCKNNQEKLCLILLYYSGARPTELTMLKGSSVWEVKERNQIALAIPTLKGGIGRTIFLPINNYTRLLLEFKEFANGFNDRDIEILAKFRKWWTIRDFIYIITDNKLTPYFFRHNRLSKLAKKGVSKETLKFFKGATSDSSVTTYLHLGGNEVKEISHLID